MLKMGFKKTKLQVKSRQFMAPGSPRELKTLKKRPNFLLIGAQKAGTTWLHRMLNQHPDIFFPEKKELHHFTNKDRVAFWGLKGYVENYFSSVRNEKWIGEATADYLWCSPAKPEWYRSFNQDRVFLPERIKEYLGGDLRLIVSLRNPVDRTVSGYFHHLQRGRITYGEPFFKMARLYGIIHLGFYYEHLARWMEVFPKENFKILFFEELMANQEAGIKDILHFLDLDGSFLPQGLDKVVYKGLARKKVGDNYYINVQDIKNQKTPVDAKIREMLIISETDIKRLKKIFRPDVRKLSNLLDRDLLSLWGL